MIEPKKEQDQPAPDHDSEQQTVPESWSKFVDLARKVINAPIDKMKEESAKKERDTDSEES